MIGARRNSLPLLLLAFAAAVALGGYAAFGAYSTERERQAQSIQTLVSSALELGRGNLKSLQPLLASLPGPPAFSLLEIRNKSGKLMDVHFEEPTPPWLSKVLPPAEPLELPLEKSGLVLKLVPSHALVSQRLIGMAYLGLPLLITGLLSLPLIARLLENRVKAGRIDDQRWAHVLMPEMRPEHRGEPESPQRQSADAEALVDHLPTAVLRCDRSGRIAYMNAVANALLGHAARGSRGQPFLELIAPWERNRVAALLANDYSRGSRATIETQALVGRGAILPVTVDIAAGPGAAGDLVIGMRDAGEMRAKQEALSARTGLLDCISHGAAILSSNQNGRILYCNEAFRELLRLPNESDGAGVLLERVAELSDIAADQLQTAVANASPACTRLSYQDRNGQTRWLELHVSPAQLGYSGETVLVCEARDRTDEIAFRHSAEQDLASQRTILDGMSVGLCITDTTGKVLDVNPQLTKLAGRSREQMVGATIDDWLVRDSRWPGPIFQGEYVIRCDSGDKTAKVNTIRLNSTAGGETYVYFFEDITTFKRNAQQDTAELERLRQILDEIAVGVITTNTEGFIQYFNPHAQSLTGLTEHEYKGMPLGQIIHLIDEKKREPLADPAMRAIRIGKPVRFRQDILLIGEDKQELAVEVSATPVRDRSNAVAGCVVLMRDVSEQRSLAQQLNLRASRDPLTGLVNRRELLTLLETLQYEVDEQNKQHTLCYMDLDRFKIINDTCGHNAGDELLRQVSDLMGKSLRANDILARIGGDEFCAVLRNTAPNSAVIVAEKIRQAIKHFRFAWDGKYFDIGVSTGIFGLLPGLTVEETVSAADEACYIAKEKGRDLVWVGSTPEESGKPASAPWNERLSVAMEHDYFRLYRQDALYLQPDQQSRPIYHEILLQLHEPGRASLAASAFMPSAQRFNLAPSIERWVIGKLLSAIWTANIRKGTLTDVYAIQLSTATLNEASFTPFLREQCRQFNIQPRMLCFEIAEDDLVQNFSLVQKFMRQCAEHGFRFCLSQFGAGISSFAYIRNLPLEFLKIGPSLTRQAESDPIDESIVRAIQDITTHMNILTMTQQVDNTTALEHLRRLGVHYAQGPAVQEPVPMEPSAEPRVPH